MAADYSKACDHSCGTMETKHGHYCVDCGTALTGPVPLAPDQHGRAVRTDSGQRPINTNELGPVKLDYDTAVNDARVLNWRRIPHGVNLPMPLDKAWYAAWRELPWGDARAVWKVERVPVGGKCPALAVWWADDVLGLPPCND